MKYIWMCSEANTWSSYYYDEQTEEFFVFDNKKGGNGLVVGVLSGISLIIYALVRNIEKPIPFDKNLLYWISLGLGVIVGAIVSGYLLRRAKRKVEENARVYPCRLEEKRKLAKQNRKSFFQHMVLIAIFIGVCVGYRFLMVWIVPSVLVDAFFNSVMCMITILLITGFVGNHPLKGWKIAGKILKGE